MTERKAFIALTLSLALLAPAVLAQELEPELNRWAFDAATIKLGYTINTPDNAFFVGVLPDVLKGETDVTVKVFDHVAYQARETYQVNATAVDRLQVNWPVPAGKVILSPIYEFDIKGAADLYNPEKPLWLRVHYASEANDNKGVYFFDKGRQEWVLIPTLRHEQDRSLRAAIHLTYAPIAILADEIPTVGEASWYRYHGCRCAASRDYPNGTLLRVTDIDTGTWTIIEVNDYGPELWTERIIDLDLVAFEEISHKGKGLTQVRVEPYLPTPEQIENHDLPNIYDPTFPL